MADYGLIGAKLSHSFSKDIHNMLGYDYDLIECQADALPIILRGGNYKGFNITVPYKEIVIPMLDFVDDSVKRIGACNTIVNRQGKLYGYNTDYNGLKDLIESQAIDIVNRDVLILGSGGTSKTAACVIADMGGYSHIVSRSGELNYANVYEKHNRAQVVINTTPYGMNPNLNAEPLIDLSKLPCLTAVIDVIFNPCKTALIKCAEKLKIQAVNGLRMLVVQAIHAARHFIGDDIVAGVDKIVKNINDKYNSIFIIGMPGSGKSTIAKMLAAKLGRTMYDSDIIIESESGKTCKEIIISSGEETFRQLESGVIKRLACQPSAIIATGGGAIKLVENRYFIACNGKVAYITRQLDKLSQDGRPLSSSIEALAKLESERKAIYESLADITVENNNGEESLGRVVEEIIGGLHL